MGLRTIGIVSGKGGVGKTTVVANLGVALSRFDKRVTLVDCNVTTSHLGFCFGYFYYPRTLNNVLKGEANILEATYFHQSGVKIIPASMSLEDLTDMDISNLKSSLEGIGETDIIILDSAPGFGREAASVLESCNEVLFVTNPYINAVSDIIRGNEIINRLGIKPLGVVLNMVRNTPFELTAKDVEELTKLPVVAEIPFDDNIQKSLVLGVPVVQYKNLAPSSIKIMGLAAELLGVRYSPPKRRFFSRIHDYFKDVFQ